MIIKRIENNPNSVKGISELIAFGSPHTDFIEGGITEEELGMALENSGDGTSLIALGSPDTEKYHISVRYIKEWEQFLKTGKRDSIEMPETLKIAEEIISGKKRPPKILEEISRNYFGAKNNEMVLGFVLGEIVPKCKHLEWYDESDENNCPARSENCGKTGYLYYLLSVLIPKEGTKRSGIGLKLAYESTKNFFKDAEINTVNAHSYGPASRELLKKLGYTHITTVPDFYDHDINPELKNAYLMCISKEKFEKMAPEYQKMGL